ncbi:AAA-domain-containing protein [Irpex rosettiformis]|uniref:AAA-domain-containing protein n=1 Tax=Irpex rosettiformis TaxID=378272 RepID=A0ACB8TPD4_9APHY|nr:AAA-domain-containing protein [Irpex rosettiformis]
MPRRAKIHYVSLHSSLVNLPISIYGPLLERGVRPQGLAVHLTKVQEDGRRSNGTGAPRGEAYVGWTGMASASSLAQFQSGEKGLETIEIDPQFAQSLGLLQGDTVEIGLLHDLGHATSVATEPVTADDWEIIELHAGHVESTLLGQVRVAVVGQQINVWVLGRTRVRLQVGNVVSLDPSTGGKALLLTSGTEVSIAPKTRPKTNGSSPAATNEEKSEKIEPTGKEAEVHSCTLRVLPSRVLPTSHPSCSALQDGSITAIGFVSRILLNEIANQPLYARPSSWRASIRRLPPPIDPSRDPNAPALPVSTQPQPRVLIPHERAPSKVASTTVAEEPSQEEVLVAWSPEVAVPDGHIIFYGSVAQVENWDHVKVDFLRESKDALTPAETDVEPAHQHVAVQKLAGVDSVISDCNAFCLASFAIHARQARVNGVPGLLVTGRSGSGKTSILRAVAQASQDNPRSLSYTLYIDLAKYTESPVSKVKRLLQYWFDKAFWHRPTVLAFDNIDKLMGIEQEHADSFRLRHITELFLEIFGSAERFAAPNAKGIVLLASAESSATVHPRLNTAHIFKEVAHLKPPDKDARRIILSHITQTHMDSSELRLDSEHPVNFTAIATQTEGYSANDLKDLVARAVHRAAIRIAEHENKPDFEVRRPTLTATDFAEAQVDFVPLSLRDVKLQKSDTAWADIGGLQETKRVLRETLEWPTKYGPIFAQSPLRLRSGLLLYGFPGCGKTLLASAVAKECGLNFISVKGPEILNKYIGASEQSVRELFERASAAKPCVLFFDEFDSIAPKRGHDSTGVTDRVVNQMLTQMDGAEGLEGVYVLAATSRPDLIDSALLRPGRLDKSLLCNMPDTVERKEILKAVSRKVTLSDSIDLEEVAQATEGFSGADLQALVYNAQLEIIHETISASSPDGPMVNGGRAADEDLPVEYEVLSGPLVGKAVKSRAEEDAFQKQLRRILASDRADSRSAKQTSVTQNTQTQEITQAHIRKVLQSARPSVSPQERERLNRIYSGFVSDRSGELPVPPDAGGIGLRATLM